MSKSKKARTEEKDEKPKLYNYWRSSCSWRVRLALATKKVEYEYIPINLLAKEHTSDAYTKKNPSQGVPALEVGGKILGQSIAIIEYLEERYPDHPLYPEDLVDRAKVRQMSQVITADTQPVQNLRVLDRVEQLVSKEARADWAKYWIEKGLAAFDALVAVNGGKYSFGDTVTVADFCLVPQMYNAKRFGVDTSKFPRLVELDKRLNELETFKAAHPDVQPDNPDLKKKEEAPQ